EDELILIRPPLAEEVAPASGGGRANNINLQQLFQTMTNAITPRERTDDRLRVLILRVNPGARLRAVLIFEPTIWVCDRDAVDLFRDIIRARLGRRRLRP